MWLQEGYTSLLRASRSGHVGMVTALLEYAPELDCQNIDVSDRSSCIRVLYTRCLFNTCCLCVVALQRVNVGITEWCYRSGGVTAQSSGGGGFAQSCKQPTV